MLKLAFGKGNGEPLRVLCLGAHSDDIEIGCGGTLLRLMESGAAVTVLWIVFSASEARAAEARLSATRFTRGAAQCEVEVKDFRDGFFPFAGVAIKEFFEELKGRIAPDVIFTHYREDRHQDHRLISDLTWNTYRDHLILEYEIPKYDGDLGRPNCFVPLDDRTCQLKVGSIVEAFRTRHNHHWFTADTFLSLMRLRGIECGASTGHAEAFFCRKAVLGMPLSDQRR